MVNPIYMYKINIVNMQHDYGDGQIQYVSLQNYHVTIFVKEGHSSNFQYQGFSEKYFLDIYLHSKA